MVPWPIALLSLYFAAIATLAAHGAWLIISGASQRPLLVHVGWVVLATGATLGLALLRPWGRVMALWTAGLLMAVLLAVAALLATVGAHPGLGIVVACGAGVQVVIMRYLQRTPVKQLFRSEDTVHG